MKKIEFDELKKIELGILIEFDKYCKKHGLRYYLYAGTLLGAVRHKGFIPWDDDIDVCMPRPDYERFYELSKTDPVSEYIYPITYRDVPSCICPFIKLQDARTKGHETDKREEFQTCVWVDVFPFDGLPADDPDFSKQIERQKRLVRLISLTTRPFVPCADPLRLVKRWFIYKHYGKMDVHEIDREIEELAMKCDYDESEFVGQLTFLKTQESIMPRAGFDEPVLLEFEGHMFPVPSNYHECLTKFYGDYMQLPPEKDRIPHPFDAWWLDGFEPEEESE